MPSVGGNDEEKTYLYTYRVLWSQEDEEYVGLCAEFPSLSWLDLKPENALKGIMNLVSEVVEDMKQNGEAVPIHLSHIKYSGKFQLRIPPELHKRLAIQAAENGVSLNRYISSKL
ncbi:type II toxin-antitoxin system HicB family antitoxin [Bartonella sp. F02]|uniref:type II toxin-antitoxin system HicB family antitoxin n=1 Tax=Bartonella sp. F02 TaxID=2967262 RepID=UPI0022A9077C|nr:type II toxin-antitoxin system HicB family antitoxin [Bartonella sp. F02]MCZ2328946.1 type II toxin-antitoxin system HicB family antitoxin [Bartonella sp. F02]